jgi:hypothetical protein
MQVAVTLSLYLLRQSKKDFVCEYLYTYFIAVNTKYSASHSRVAPENVGLQKEQKYNTFACRTCNEVRLCFENSQNGSWQHEKIR